MARNREDLVLSARYIHTGNSGVSFSVNRDVKRVDRSTLSISNGAFGAFSTKMEIRGNDYAGMTSRQLRDLALMFMDAAAYLDAGTLPLMSDTPAIITDDGRNSTERELPTSLQDLLPSFNDHLNVRGDELVPTILAEFPRMREFYEVYVARVSGKSDTQREAEKDCSESTEESEAQIPRDVKLRLRQEALKGRLDSLVMNAGIGLLRSWWTASLAKAALESAEEVFEDALARKSAVLNATSDEDLVGDSRVRGKGPGILSR